MQLRFIYLLSTGVTSNAIGGCANVVESHVSIQTSNGETVGRGVVLDRDDALIMLWIKYIRHFHLSDLVSLCGVGSQNPRNHPSVCIAGEYLGRLLNVDSYITSTIFQQAEMAGEPSEIRLTGWEAMLEGEDWMP